MLPNRSWDRPSVADDAFDEFEPAGFDEDGLAECGRSHHDAAGKLRTPSRAEGEAGLEEYLVERWLKGSMTAKEICTIAWWATAAGATGFVTTLSFRPDAPTGHFARHLRTVFERRSAGDEPHDDRGAVL